MGGLSSGTDRRRLGIAVLCSAVVLSLVVYGSGEASASNGSNGEIIVTGSGSHTAVDGVDFTRFDCRYQGEADAIAYVRVDGTTGPVQFDVTCSLILPSDPNDWNGNLLVEPLVQPFDATGELVRDLDIGEDVIFGGKKNQTRTGYASISYSAAAPDDSVDQEFFFPIDFPAVSVEILADFASALREGTPYGPAVTVTAATGVGSSGVPAVRGAMVFGEEHGFAPFDAALIGGGVSTLTPDAEGRFASIEFGPVKFGDQRALFVRTEFSLIFDLEGFGLPGLPSLPPGTVGRVEADGINRFIYEIAGAALFGPVIQQDTQHVFPPGFFNDSNPLDWSPIRRAVYVQMEKWVMEGKTPEPSRLLDPPADPNVPDPAYPSNDFVGDALVGRDADNNATGGVRLPNMDLGVGTYLAVGDSDPSDPDSDFLLVFAGGFIDLSCTSTADGSRRFNSHGHYVGQYSKLTDVLVEERFVLEEDAEAMKATARESDIGECD